MTGLFRGLCMVNCHQYFLLAEEKREEQGGGKRGGQREDGGEEKWRETFFILILKTRGENTPKNEMGEDNIQDTEHAFFLQKLPHLHKCT